MTMSGSATNKVFKWDFVPGASYDVAFTTDGKVPEESVRLLSFQTVDPWLKITLPKSRTALYTSWVRAVNGTNTSGWSQGPRIYVP